MHTHTYTPMQLMEHEMFSCLEHNFFGKQPLLNFELFDISELVNVQMNDFYIFFQKHQLVNI